MHKRSNIFWGLLLIILASLLLLRQFDLLPGQIWDYFWPAVLMLVGIWVLIGYFLRGNTSQKDTVTQDIGTARSIFLKIEHGAGRLTIDGKAPVTNAFTCTCNGGMEVQRTQNGDRLDLKLKTPSQFWEWAPSMGLDWDLSLPMDVPVKLSIHSGASTSLLDFSDLLLTDLKLDTGASQTVLTMPAHAGKTNADIDTGVSTVKIIIPKGVSARIRVKTGISTLNIDKQRFQSMGDNIYQSADYPETKDQLDLTIDSGIGTLDIQ